MGRLGIVILAMVLFAAAPAAPAELVTFTTAPLTIDTAAGPQHFTVEMALTPQQQEQGLMYRTALPADAGMLFILPQTQIAIFWMKNTVIPLDMLFITQAGRVADIHERAVPMSEANIESKVPVRAVLELNGGTVARLKIKVGDVVHQAEFKNAAP